MTSDEFRQLALALPEATEGSHMSHADFRVKGKIFATNGIGGGQDVFFPRAPPEASGSESRVKLGVSAGALFYIELDIEAVEGRTFVEAELGEVLVVLIEGLLQLVILVSRFQR